MKISVIIPSYKPESYIFKCIDSLLNQTFDKKDFEIIIVLNGCNEPYFNQLNNYLKEKAHDFFYHLIQTNQAGVSNARNIGLDKASGQFISFVDDDDYVSPTYLTELYEISTKDTVGLSNTIAFDDKTGDSFPNYRIGKRFVEHKEVSIHQGRKHFSGPAMKLIHREMIGNRRFDLTFKVGEDSLFMFLISDKIRKCKFTSSASIYYRRYRENSATTKKKSVKEVSLNQMRLIVNYTKIYFTNLSKYSFKFYFTRILGAKRSWLYQLILKK